MSKIQNLFIVIFLTLISLATGYGVWKKSLPIPSDGEEYDGQRPPKEQCVHPVGIDLSHFNTAYDWNDVDVQFVYVRASQGTTVTDRKYNRHREAAERHRIPVGAYHFMSFKSPVESQFQHFTSLVKKEHTKLRLMLDVEEYCFQDLTEEFTRDDFRREIRKWCDLCKAYYGKAPIIYTTEAIYIRLMLDKGFEDCLWWVANYNHHENYESRCVIPYTIYQYCDTNYVAGFYTRIDCDSFRTGKSVKDLLLETPCRYCR